MAKTAAVGMQGASLKRSRKHCISTTADMSPLSPQLAIESLIFAQWIFNTADCLTMTILRGGSCQKKLTCKKNPVKAQMICVALRAIRLVPLAVFHHPVLKCF